MNLRDQLQAHLGNAFLLERELGGGGMSRVFVANEVRLSRKVVIKVLSPELVQGLNAERFEREILLAASLQQANIVPVLTAGEVGGLPYFTMPFVEGESLRGKIGSGGLPIDDVLAILRDVAKALAYAHARGIVHRDIKPDNVLLSGGTAVVTDFGIAKALSASRTEVPGATLTQLGTSIGTPAYMAPEQVAGDPDLDHRVDLYSLGCMAQELLTGKAPFADRTPQKTLAAHLSETAIPVSVLRADTPPALTALITRLLQKDPADRTQSANDVLGALTQIGTTPSPTVAPGTPSSLTKVLGIHVLATGAVALLAKAAVVAIGLPDWVFPGAVAIMLLGLPALLITAYAKGVARNAVNATPTLTPGGTLVPKMPSGTMATMALRASPHLSFRRTARYGMFAMGAFVLAVIAFMAMRSLGIGAAGSLFAKGQLAADDRIVLADFIVSKEDSALAPILVAAVRAAMSQSKSIRIVDEAGIADVLQQMQRKTDSGLDRDLSHEVAQRAGAKAVLSGRLARIGAGYAVSLDISSADKGISLASFQATANGAQDLLPVVDKLTRDLRNKIGESMRQVQRSIPLEQATTASLEALRKFTEGTRANDIDGDYDRAVQLLREAVALDSTFALAWRKLGVALSNAVGSIEAQDSALAQAFRFADRLPYREKYLAIGAYYQYSRLAGDRGKAFSAYQAAYAADSNSSISSNQLTNLFAARLDRDSTLRYARRQLAIRQDVPTTSYLATFLATFGLIEEATEVVDSLLKATPAAANFDGIVFVRGLIYRERGNGDSLEAQLEQYRRSSSPALRTQSLSQLVTWKRQTGSMASAASLHREHMALLASRNAAVEIDGLFETQTDIVYLGRKEAGVRALDQIIAGHQWSGARPVDRPYIAATRLYAIAGRPDRAREMLARYLSDDSTARQPSSANGVANAQGEIALADGKFDEALKLFRRAGIAEDGFARECDACIEYNLARAFDAAGKADSALAHFTAYLAVPIARRYNLDGMALAIVQKRMGELYDNRNERNKAIEHYTAFVNQWKNADAELQPAVATVRKRLDVLRAQEGK